MIEAGALNRRVTFQKKTIGRTENGYPTETWTDHSSRWAEKITTGGREFYAAQKINEATEVLYRLRFTAALTTSMRIRDGHSYYEILPPLNDVGGRHEELLISAKELR